MSSLFRTKTIEQLQRAPTARPGSTDISRGPSRRRTSRPSASARSSGPASSPRLGSRDVRRHGVTRPPAGPGVLIRFLLTAVACGFSAFCYAEMAAMIPVSGSAYTYSYATLGELMAWIIGWDLLLEYASRTWPSRSRGKPRTSPPGSWSTCRAASHARRPHDTAGDDEFLEGASGRVEPPARLGYSRPAKTGARRRGAFPSWTLIDRPRSADFPIGLQPPRDVHHDRHHVDPASSASRSPRASTT